MILNDVSFEAYEGQTYAIIGKSGSGKSTLINILATLDKNYSGKLFISNKQVNYNNDKEVSKIRNEDLGFVFQSYQLVEKYTVFENMLLPTLYLKESKINHELIIDEILKDLDLYDLKNNKVNELSGGEMQRVAIARAIVNSPKIIIADEPTGNLDDSNMEKIMEIFNSIKKRGVAVIIVTHDMRVANLCDNLYEISNMKINKVK
ncbi:ABC transporter ATP-binding protein [Haploplasma axanthum]|nr:ABC transporter ATP-binding protein [Haploplasma axanthum]